MMLWALPGQAVHTTIKVVDAQDHTPLAFARIRIHETGQIYQSNPQGIVRLSVDKWPQTATISYIGYHDLHLTLTKERTLYEAALQPLSYTLGSVQVVGDRVKGSKTGNIAQADAFRIAAGQGQTLAGILDDLPGMRVLSTGAMIEKPIIEGMNGSRIAIIDNSAKLIGQHWGDDHAPEMSISSYAKVHVEKGAESVRYGANAIGGIIVVDTKVDPRLSGTKGSVNTAYTQNGRMFGLDAFVESTLPGVEHFRYRVGGKFYKSGDYRTAAYNVSNTGSRLLDLKAAWAWQWNDKWQWKQHLGLYDTEIGVFRAVISVQPKICCNVLNKADHRPKKSDRSATPYPHRANASYTRLATPKWATILMLTITLMCVWFTSKTIGANMKYAKPTCPICPHSHLNSLP